MASNAPSAGSRRWLNLGSLPWFRGEKMGQRVFRTRALDTLPRTITHERIYILPSRRGWNFLLSLLIMLITSINYNLSLGYALCFLLTGLFTAALLATYKNLAGLQVTGVDTAEAISGDALLFPVTVFNHGSSDRIGIDVGNSTIICRGDVAAGKEQTLHIPMPTIKRGIQPCGRLTISSDYPLGLWFTWSYLHVACDGLVLARPETDPPPLPSGVESLPEGHARPSTQGEFVSIRHYQPGDSMGAIAWKAAARGQGLFTREFAAEQRSAETTLSWESTRGLESGLDPGLHPGENRISRLAAWVRQATENDIAFSLELPGESLATGQGPAHGRAAQRMLALYKL